MIKRTGDPRFDALSLVSLTVHRMGVGDEMTAKFVYLDRATHQTFGSVDLTQTLLLQDKETTEAFEVLMNALERHASTVLFDQQSTEKKSEGIHDEPQGIIDTAEEDGQI